MGTPLSPHFDLEEFVHEGCRRDKCALPFNECVDNLRALCVMVLEPWRVIAGPIGIFSGLRDLVSNLKNARDPASAARVAKRPGPHTTGQSADVHLLSIQEMDEPARSQAYEHAFAQLYKLAQQGLPVHEAILEYGQGKPIAGQETSPRVLHIHVQYRSDQAARRFVTRKWKVDGGQLAEKYERWAPPNAA